MVCKWIQQLRKISIVKQFFKLRQRKVSVYNFQAKKGWVINKGNAVNLTYLDIIYRVITYNVSARLWTKQFTSKTNGSCHATSSVVNCYFKFRCVETQMPTMWVTNLVWEYIPKPISCKDYKLNAINFFFLTLNNWSIVIKIINLEKTSNKVVYAVLDCIFVIKTLNIVTWISGSATTYGLSSLSPKARETARTPPTRHVPEFQKLIDK